MQEEDHNHEWHRGNEAPLRKVSKTLSPDTHEILRQHTPALGEGTSDNTERSNGIQLIIKVDLRRSPNQWHQDYKHARGRGRGYHWRDNPYGGKLQGVNLRSAIVDQATLDQFETKFADGADAFKSATEICDIHLIPEDIASRINKPSSSMGTYTPELEEMEDGSYWRDHSLVGDNSRERPYANIQQRVTTKSNTFRVHYRAQVLKQSRRTGGSGYETWKPELDSVVAEYRGDSIVERFVDPNLETLPDFSTSAPSGGTDDSIDPYYEFRVVNPRRFAP